MKRSRRADEGEEDGITHRDGCYTGRFRTVPERTRVEDRNAGTDEFCQAYRKGGGEERTAEGAFNGPGRDKRGETEPHGDGEGKCPPTVLIIVRSVLLFRWYLSSTVRCLRARKYV